MFDQVLKMLGLSKEKVEEIATQTQARVEAFEKSLADLHAKVDQLLAVNSQNDGDNASNGA